MIIRNSIFPLVIVFTLSCDDNNRSADIIILSSVYTVNMNHPWAEALVVRGDKIIFVGHKSDALKFKNESTIVINEPNGMVLPGFIDTHVHLLWGGIEMDECNLSGLASPGEVELAIASYAKKYPNREWIRGNGWSLPIFPNGNPSKEFLDKIVSERPVYLLSSDGHSAWVNSKALEISGVDRHTKDPKNGRIERDSVDGQPSGILREDAMHLVESMIPPYTKEQIDKGLSSSVKEATKVGITSILDAGTESYNQKNSNLAGYDGLDAYQNATNYRTIPLRINATQYVSPESWREDLIRIKKRRFKNKLGTMNTVKMFTDGVIEGGTASLLEVYKGTNHYGILNWVPDTLKKVVAAYDREGFQIHFHAIGDRAIRITLDAFEYARNVNGFRDMRHMISHAQLIHPKDMGRFKELDIIACFQPLWAYPDPYMKELTLPVLGPVRSKWNYPLKSLVSTGARITGGSDWSVTSLNPLYGIEVAVTRKEPGNINGEVLFIEEAIDLKTIIKAYTLDAAYSLFKDNEIGSLEKNKLADITLLDKNLFDIPNHEIHNAEVIMTIFNGEIVYDIR